MTGCHRVIISPSQRGVLAKIAVPQDERRVLDTLPVHARRSAQLAPQNSRTRDRATAWSTPRDVNAERVANGSGSIGKLLAGHAGRWTVGTLAGQTDGIASKRSQVECSQRRRRRFGGTPTSAGKTQWGILADRWPLHRWAAGWSTDAIAWKPRCDRERCRDAGSLAADRLPET